MEILDASDSYPRRIKAKAVLIRKMVNSFFHSQMEQQVSGRDYEFRVPTLRREQPVRREQLSGEIQGESEESQLAESTDDAEARGDFSSIQDDFIYRHHNEQRVQHHVPRK